MSYGKREASPLANIPFSLSYIQLPRTHVCLMCGERESHILFVGICNRDRDGEIDRERDGPLKAKPWG